MKIPFLTPLFRTVARHGITLVAGGLIVRGWVAQDQANAAADYLADYGGACVLGLLSMSWSYVEKRWLIGLIKKIQLALEVPATGHATDLLDEAQKKGGA